MRAFSLSLAAALTAAAVAVSSSAVASEPVPPIDDSLAPGARLADAPGAPWHPTSIDVAVEGSYGAGYVGGQDLFIVDLAAIARVGVGAFGVAATASGGFLGASGGGSALGGIRAPLNRYFVFSALGEVGVRERNYTPLGLAPAVSATLGYVGTRTSITFRTPGTLGLELGLTAMFGDDLGRASATVAGDVPYQQSIGGLTAAVLAHVGIAIDGGQTL